MNNVGNPYGRARRRRKTFHPAQLLSQICEAIPGRRNFSPSAVLPLMRSSKLYLPLAKSWSTLKILSRSVHNFP